MRLAAVWQVKVSRYVTGQTVRYCVTARTLPCDRSTVSCYAADRQLTVGDDDKVMTTRSAHGQTSALGRSPAAYWSPGGYRYVLKVQKND